MTAVYKRELKSYLTSMIGYLFIFFILVLAGIYFSAYQLSSAYPKFEYTMSALTFVFLISVPILTMRVLAEERKQKTDQLLLTSPVSVTGIVMGKYLALVTVFSIPMAVMCTYPLSSWMCQYCHWRILFIYNRKPGDRSSAYFCIFVCILHDEWDFFILFADSTFYMHCIWLPDSCVLYHYLYYD